MTNPIQIIEHRRNTLEQLETVNKIHGVEIDVRAFSNSKGAYLSHDPFENGPNLDDWLFIYKTQKIEGPILFNTKEDGLEELCIELCQKYKLENFFFIDTPGPTLIRHLHGKFSSRFMPRVSNFENPTPLSSLLNPDVHFLWIDCFFGVLTHSAILNNWQNFNWCLVSTELHGVKIPPEPYPNLITSNVKMICTKHPDIWIRSFTKKIEPTLDHLISPG